MIIFLATLLSYLATSGKAFDVSGLDILAKQTSARRQEHQFFEVVDHVHQSLITDSDPSLKFMNERDVHWDLKRPYLFICIFKMESSVVETLVNEGFYVNTGMFGVNGNTYVYTNKEDADLAYAEQLARRAVSYWQKRP